ncbi:MAG: ATP-binding cassette domain-containing protein [Planctomycetota bacterium]|nr:ATP-binding cassette domain-containing protein [Planctomycetota bacterium]
MAMIEVSDLRKQFRVFQRATGVMGGIKNLFIRRYEALRAVDGVSFSIEKGEMVGYIGANGAGKSTTIKMLTGILVPTSGRIIANGYVPHVDRKRYTMGIGVVFGQRTQLWWDLAVQESFHLLRKIYDVPQEKFDERMDEFHEVLGIGDYLRLPVRKLSLGQRMRCDLAAALLHHPPLLFLDEPTIGLYVVAKESVREFLRKVTREMEVTIILTTQDLGDIEELCERILIIDKGKILYDGSLEGIRNRQGREVTLTVDLKEIPPVADLERIVEGNGIAWTAMGGRRFRAKFNRDDVATAEVVRNLAGAFQIHDIIIEEPGIEDVVRRIYREGSL